MARPQSHVYTWPTKGRPFVGTLWNSSSPLPKSWMFSDSVNSRVHEDSHVMNTHVSPRSKVQHENRGALALAKQRKHRRRRTMEPQQRRDAAGGRGSTLDSLSGAHHRGGHGHGATKMPPNMSTTDYHYVSVSTYATAKTTSFQPVTSLVTAMTLRDRACTPMGSDRPPLQSSPRRSPRRQSSPRQASRKLSPRPSPRLWSPQCTPRESR